MIYFQTYRTEETFRAQALGATKQGYGYAKANSPEQAERWRRRWLKSKGLTMRYLDQRPAGQEDLGRYVFPEQILGSTAVEVCAVCASSPSACERNQDMGESAYPVDEHPYEPGYLTGAGGGGHPQGIVGLITIPLSVLADRVRIACA